MSKAKPSSVTTPSIPAAHACAFSCFFGIFHESLFSPRFCPRRAQQHQQRTLFLSRAVAWCTEKGRRGKWGIVGERWEKGTQMFRPLRSYKRKWETCDCGVVAVRRRCIRRPPQGRTQQPHTTVRQETARKRGNVLLYYSGDDSY